VAVTGFRGFREFRFLGRPAILCFPDNAVHSSEAFDSQVCVQYCHIFHLQVIFGQIVTLFRNFNPPINFRHLC